MNSSTDRIERQILLRAPPARVWRALADAKQFGSWFGVDFKDQVFAPGAHLIGQITYPGYEHLRFNVWIERMEPERLLSWRWHPAAIDAARDYSQEPTTLVVFELEQDKDGTLLSLIESGFDAIPSARRQEAFRMNSGGWEQQMRNIEKHVAAP